LRARTPSAWEIAYPPEIVGSRLKLGRTGAQLARNARRSTNVLASPTLSWLSPIGLVDDQLALVGVDPQDADLLWEVVDNQYFEVGDRVAVVCCSMLGEFCRFLFTDRASAFEDRRCVQVDDLAIRFSVERDDVGS
jgi:hypothetical protein